MSLDAEDIRNEKVKVLRSMSVVKREDAVLGQYRCGHMCVTWCVNVCQCVLGWVGDVVGKLHRTHPVLL